MPHQFVLNCLSSKANFVFNQTLFTLLRERSAFMTPSNFFWIPFWKSYSQTKGKFYLVNLSHPAKPEKTHRRITLEQEINPVQIPHPSKAMFKSPLLGHDAQSNARGMPGGGGCWSFNIAHTCSAVTDSTGNPICFVHVSMTAATGLELTWDKLAHKSSEQNIIGKSYICNLQNAIFNTTNWLPT